MNLDKSTIDEITDNSEAREVLYKFCFEVITSKVVDKIFRKLKKSISKEVATDIAKKILKLL